MNQEFFLCEKKSYGCPECFAILDAWFNQL